MPKKGKVQMVYEVKEMAEARPIEKEVRDFDWWCTTYGLRSTVRVLLHPLALQSFAEQADRLQELAMQLRLLHSTMQNTHGATPEQMGQIASRAETLMKACNRQIKTGVLAMEEKGKI